MVYLAAPARSPRVLTHSFSPSTCLIYCKRYLDDKSDGEICDILEVIYAICAARGITQDQIAEAREKKRNKNGAFDKRIWLEKVVIGSK